MSLAFPSRYVVYDLETTGLDHKRDEAVEIGAMKVDGDIVETKTWLLMPTVPISAEASKVNGITQEELNRDGMRPRDAWLEFAQFIGLAREEHKRMVVTDEKMLPVVGHNIVRFDNKFVLRALSEHLRPQAFPMVNSIDTAALYKGNKLAMMQHEGEAHFVYAQRVLSVYSKGLKYKLTDVFKEFGGVLEEGMRAHRAAADVYMTNFVYRKIAGLDTQLANK